MSTAARLLRLARTAVPTDPPTPIDTELLRRYVAERDEAAFTELVRRNGPLVLRVCRHVLGETAADDAFQATFLLLVRSAPRLTRPGSLAGWLHTAAVRIAHQARRGENRRRKREAARQAPAAGSDDLTWREVREVLDTEIAALPECYRLPVVLCYLQELSHEEAARRAGCSDGALRGRLERGKERLRKRLARYGLPLAAPALVVGCPPPVSAAQIEGVMAAVRSGLSGAVPSTLAGLVGQPGWLRIGLLFAPAVVAVGIALAAGSSSPADPPQVEPPKTVTAIDPVKRTDRFGDPLPDGALMRLGTLRDRATIHGFGTAPDGSVVTVSQPDAKRVVAEARVWPPNADPPGEPFRLGDYERGTFKPCAAVSPDGQYVAVNTALAVVVWERTGDTFKEIGSFDCYHTRHLLFAPDGIRVVVAGVGVHLFDPRTGKSLKFDESQNYSFESCTISGDGKRLATTSGRDVALWDAETGAKLADFKTGRLRYTGIALDHTGKVLAVSPTWEPWTVAFVDPMTGLPVADLAAPEKFRCLWASYAPDGKTVLLGDRDGVTWWDPAAGKVIRRFEGMAQSWSGGQNVPARFTPDGKALVGTSGRALLRWDAATGKPLRPEVHDAGHHAEVNTVGGSADGKWVVTGGRDTRVRVWDAATGRSVAAFSGAWMGGPRNLDFSPDGRFVYGPSADDSGVTKWEAATGREVLRFGYSPDAPKRGQVYAFWLAPDGRTVAAVADPFSSGTPDLFARWDTGSGKTLAEKPFPSGVRMGSTIFSPDGRWVSASSTLYPVEVGPAGNTLPREAWKDRFDPGAFSADGRLLAKVLHSWAGDVIQWRVAAFEVATGAKVAETPLDADGRPAFHPDGRSVAVAEAKRLAFYDLRTGKAFGSWKAPGPNPDAPSLPFAQVVRYTPYGTKVVTGHADTTALIWQAPPRPKTAKALTEKERAAAWADLAWADGARGWAAVWALADDPAAAAFLRGKVRPVEPLPAKEFDRLLADLDSDDFQTRADAAKQLGDAGERAVGQLQTALKGELPAEPRAAVLRLLKPWPAADQTPPAGERLRVVRAVAALELAGTADARKLLAELAAGAADATTTREAAAALRRAGGR